MPARSPDHAFLAEVTGGPLRPGGLELTTRALKRLDLPPRARILDAGCGNGASLSLLAQCGYRVVGLDLSSTNLTRADNKSLPLVQAAAEDLPLQNQVLDAVLCECVLSLLPRPDKALREFHRTLKPGGVLVASDIFARARSAVATYINPGSRCCLDGARSRDEVEALLTGAGFTVELWEDHSRLLAQLASQIIFSCGSLREFWASLLPHGDARAGQICAASAAVKPGYYLLIARKGR